MLDRIQIWELSWPREYIKWLLAQPLLDLLRLVLWIVVMLEDDLGIVLRTVRVGPVRSMVPTFSGPVRFGPGLVTGPGPDRAGPDPGPSQIQWL